MRSSVVIGAVGGFIGGVLVTAAIAGCLAAAVFCRGKRELTTMAKVKIQKSKLGKLRTLWYTHTYTDTMYIQCIIHVPTNMQSHMQILHNCSVV